MSMRRSQNMTPQTSHHRLVPLFVLFLSAAATAAPPGPAGDRSVAQEPSTAVKFADLDLNTDAGRRELLDRLSKAANRVCAQDAVLHSDIAYPYVFGSACHDRALAAAVNQFHHAQLSALLADLTRTHDY
jgi:UrcA family protein